MEIAQNPERLIFEPACPNRQVIDLITNKWSILILHTLKHGPLRFVTLQEHLSGISQKVLTQTLRKLERNGLVSRTIFAQVPPRVDYELTPLGQSLREQISAFLRWSGEEYSGNYRCPKAV